LEKLTSWFVLVKYFTIAWHFRYHIDRIL
jgi:hypothetical protein